MFRRDTDSSVLHGKERMPVLNAGRHRHGSVLFIVPDRVVAEIIDQFLHQLLIRENRRFSALNPDRHILFLGIHLEHVYTFSRQRKQIQISILHIFLSAVKLGKLDDIVIFSYDAVYGVEEGSGNALQLETGDKLTVEDCMYAMLLKSSNQAANALAEYVAGSNEKFAEHMNEKAQELGCTDSNFVNPSGLNAEDQKVTAEDMAKIAAAAFSNDTVREIASAKTYQLPVTLNNPNGCIVEMEHQLLNGTDYSYKYAYAGKTGYTDAAGNTLVTAARKNDKNLIAVVLKSEMTHYTDTIKLFNYGFAYLEQQTQETEAEEESVDTEKVKTVPEEQKKTTPDHTVINVVKGIFFLIILYGASLIFRRKKSRLQKKRKNIKKAGNGSKKSKRKAENNKKIP